MNALPLTEQMLRAHGVAELAHQGQKRKYGDEDYIYHPRRVADLVRTAGCSEDAVCAAFLHDVVEDTWVSSAAIDALFGPGVGSMVWLLTTEKRVGENRRQRKARERSRLLKCPPEVATIKLADLIDNTWGIVKHDPDFAKTYLQEKAELLPVLMHGNESLHAVATDQVRRYMEKL